MKKSTFKCFLIFTKWFICILHAEKGQQGKGKCIRPVRGMTDLNSSGLELVQLESMSLCAFKCTTDSCKRTPC